MSSLTEELTKAAESAATTKTVRSAKLAEAATAGTEARSLNELVLRIAEAEGEESAYARMSLAAEYAERQGQDVRATVNEAAMELLAQGADDGWSGRGNDVRRARFDGVREAVRDSKFMGL